MATLPPELRRLNIAVRRLVAAEIQDTWAGAGDPADIPIIERELEEARKRYRDELNALATRLAPKQS